MPKVADQFAGHMYPDDPRSLLWAARGCIWPTVPAFHFLAKSTNATGGFTFFNTDIVLLEMITAPPAHDTAVYFWEVTPGSDLWMTAIKTQSPSDAPGYRWALRIHFPGAPAVAFKEMIRPLEKCNGPVDVGSMSIVLPFPGDTGSTFKLLPVIWDETVPPT